MAELVLTVSGRHLALPQNVPEQITNTEFIDAVRFECDSQYNGYELVAVFKNGEHGTPYPVAVPHDRSAVSIDPRALRRKGWLYVGMYGLDGLKVLPTLWASAIEIKDGTDTSGTENPDDPVPSVYAALVARVGALEDAVDDLEETVDDLESTVGDLETAVDQLGDTVSEIEGDVADLQTSKQDVITDLDTIRSGAAAGATALQSVPMANADTLGGVKVYPQAGWDGYGVKINNSGCIYVARANDNTIQQRTNEYNPIVPKTVDKAVSAALCSPIREYTDEEKAAACATIGASLKEGTGWDYIGTMTSANEFHCNLEGYTEIMIKGETIGTGTSNFFVGFSDNTGAFFVSGACKNGKRRFISKLSDIPFGVAQTLGKYADDVNHWTLTSALNGGAEVTNNRIGDVYRLYFGAPSAVTSCNVEIYAR